MKQEGKNKAKKLGIAKESLMEYILPKTIGNSLYGCLAENKHGIGHLSNFVLASIITSETRLKIRKLCLQLRINPLVDVLEFATDAIAINKDKIPKDMIFSGKLGEFELDDSKYPQTLIFVSSGFSLDKDGNPIRNRGIPFKPRENQKGKPNYSMNQKFFLFERERPLHIVEALLHVNESLDAINQFSKKFGTKRIAYYDERRIWLRDGQIILELEKEDLFSGKVVSLPLTEYDMNERDESLLDQEEVNTWIDDYEAHIRELEKISLCV